MTLDELKSRLDQIAHCAAHFVRTSGCGDCLVAETAWLRANGWGEVADAVDAGEQLKQLPTATHVGVDRVAPSGETSGQAESPKGVFTSSQVANMATMVAMHRDSFGGGLRADDDSYWQVWDEIRKALESYAAALKKPAPAGISLVIRDVAELPDYFGRDDDPNMLFVSTTDLQIILERHWPAVVTSAPTTLVEQLAILSEREIAHIEQKERGIPQAHEMARVTASHEALRALAHRRLRAARQAAGLPKELTERILRDCRAFDQLERDVENRQMPSPSQWRRTGQVLYGRLLEVLARDSDIKETAAVDLPPRAISG